MSNILYNLIIFPLSNLLELTYQLIVESTHNEPLAIISLSVVVTLCTLPLYMVAEGWQEKERLIHQKLTPGIDRIKKAFKGDEQYMILNTFYRQNHYSPIMALRSSFSLLIQIPFFMAAYHFLSDLGTLKGVGFLFIRDLGNPDSTFKIGNFAVNVLPIAMTLINCASGFLYSKGHSIREKLQIYIFAAVFLVILYDSPSGLVLYWTMNNIFSLVKNIFYKLKNPKKVLYILMCAVALLFIVSPLTVFTYQKKAFRYASFAFGFLLPFIPFIVKYLARFFDRHFKILDEQPKLRNVIFFSSALALVVLSGLAIPSTIIESEPNNYCYVDSYSSPFVFLTATFFQSVGIFFVWASALYGLFSKRIKKILTVFLFLSSFITITNCFIFGGHYGPIEPWLEFMQPQEFTQSLGEIIINALLLFAISVASLLLLVKVSAAAKSLIMILVIALTGISVRNIFVIQNAYAHIPTPTYDNELEPIFHLSKTEKNVIVLMQDRCFSPFIPYVLDELPQLNEKFDGFTYYPNSISQGKLTMIGTPGLFGGYDYTPFRMNERAIEEPEKTLQDKHNEAMLTLPLIFTEKGFRAEVANLPYENYLEQPEANMYIENHDLTAHGIELEEHSDIEKTSYTVKYKGHEAIRHNKTLATYTNYWYAQHGMTKEPYISSKIFRNFIWFSLFKMFPPVFR